MAFPGGWMDDGGELSVLLMQMERLMASQSTGIASLKIKSCRLPYGILLVHDCWSFTTGSHLYPIRMHTHYSTCHCYCLQLLPFSNPGHADYSPLSSSTDSENTECKHGPNKRLVVLTEPTKNRLVLEDGLALARRKTHMPLLPN
ncbi:hypothetical protein BHE74_00001887 [Ensete ventricosum]|nr:hypothetical protein BHE74_00001887 [Ensete ventricosum]